MKLLLISLAVCLTLGTTYAQWGPQTNDDVANFYRPLWQPTWVNQDRYRSYVTPNWANGWNSYIQNPFRFWYQPYSALPYPMGLNSRYLYQDRWNQYPISQYKDNWSYRNNYNFNANQPWNGLGRSQRQEYRPFRTEAYQGPIAQDYYPRERFNVYPESMQPSYNWNLRNWDINRQYHPMNAYHPYPIRSYQPTSAKTYPSYPTESYHPYPIRSHHSYPSETVQSSRPSWRQSHQPNLISKSQPDQSEHGTNGWYKKSYNPFSVQSERPSPTERNWYLNRHNPHFRSHQPSVNSYDSQPIWSHPSSVRPHYSHVFQPHRFYPLNFYLNQQANNHQHPKGVHYYNDNENNFYHLYHSHPSQSHNVSPKKYVVPIKKDPIDLSALWFLNKLLNPASPKPVGRSSFHPGFMPFDVVIVKKIVSPVKSKVLNLTHQPVYRRPDAEVNSLQIKENPSTTKPVGFSGVKPESIKPLQEKVSEDPQHTVLMNSSQPSSSHTWYPHVKSWHPAKDTSTKPTTATVA